MGRRMRPMNGFGMLYLSAVSSIDATTTSTKTTHEYSHTANNSVKPQYSQISATNEVMTVTLSSLSNSSRVISISNAFGAPQDTTLTQAQQPGRSSVALPLLLFRSHPSSQVPPPELGSPPATAHRALRPSPGAWAGRGVGASSAIVANPSPQ